MLAALLALEHLDSLKLLPASWRPATFEIQAGDGARESPRTRRLEEVIPVADELRIRGPVPLFRCTQTYCEAIERDFTPVSIALLEPPFDELEATEDDLVIAVSIPGGFYPGHVTRGGYETLHVRVSDIGGGSPTPSVIHHYAVDFLVRPRK